MPNKTLIQDVIRPQRRVRPQSVQRSRVVAPISYTPSRPHHTKKSFGSRLKFASAFMVLVFMAGFFLKQFLLSAKSGDSSQIAEALSQKPVEPAVDVAALKTKIDAIIAKYPDHQISVAYSDIKTPASLNTGVDAPYIAASTSKLLTAVLYLSEVEDGLHSLNEKIGKGTARSQLELLIEDSDNEAWHNFNDLLTHEKLEEYAKSVGLKNFSTLDNLCTAEDISTLLGKLYKRELLNDVNTNLLLSFMQKASENQYIVAALPAGVKAYHKAGYLDDRAHDAAIVENGNQPFTLVIFTKVDADYDFAVGQEIFHELTKAVLAAYK